MREGHNKVINSIPPLIKSFNYNKKFFHLLVKSNNHSYIEFRKGNMEIIKKENNDKLTMEKHVFPREVDQTPPGSPTTPTVSRRRLRHFQSSTSPRSHLYGNWLGGPTTPHDRRAMMSVREKDHDPGTPPPLRLEKATTCWLLPQPQPPSPHRRPALSLVCA